MSVSIRQQIASGVFALAAVVLTAASLIVIRPVSAQSAAPTPVEAVSIEPGTHKLVRANGTVSRVAVGEPTIADANVINGRELLINGKKPGTTTLLVWTRVGKGSSSEPTEYRVTVAPAPVADASNLLAHRRASLASGAGKDGGTLVDRSFVGGETQVMSHVRIVEVNRRSLQQYGINLFKIGNNSLGGFGNPSTVSSTLLSGNNGLTGTLASATGFLPIGDAFNIIFGNNGYTGILSVLERKGLARTLAEPSLTAMSGQTASFLAGGEFPYPVPQGGTGNGGTITVQFREFGVRLNLTPTVLTNNRIAIKVAPEVSDLDFTNSLTISGTTVPGLIIRRTDTTVELGDGETFVLSGLVSNNLTNNVDKVPWLGDIPVLGAFFRSTRIDRTEKELIMVITPHLVRPLARDAQLPPLPGEAAGRYRPNFAETMFLETGTFGQEADTGYSK